MKKAYIIIDWIGNYDDNDIVELEIPNDYDTSLLTERIENRMRELREDIGSLDGYEAALNELGLKWRYVENMLGTVYID